MVGGRLDASPHQFVGGQGRLLPDLHLYVDRFTGSLFQFADRFSRSPWPMTAIYVRR